MTAAILLALFILPGWLYLLGTAIAARRFARGAQKAPSGVPPASVLKPLCGAEPGLYDNLRSFAEQDYPQFEVVLGLRDSRDAALPVARALIRDLPGRQIRLVVEPRVAGSNRKVANLENMLPAARHGLLVLADSDIRVGPSYLSAVATPLADPRVGAVTCLYKGVGTGGFWSLCAALHINFGFLPGAILADSLGIGRGCFGATIALRREVLERIGGFAPLRDELADDHRLGDRVRELGLEVVLSRYLVEHCVTEPSFKSLWRHELRWARTIRAVAAPGHAASVFAHPVALAALAAALQFGLTSCAFLGISCALRWASAGMVARALHLDAGKLWLLPMRDGLSFAVFLASFFGRRVFWGEQQLRVAASGRMTVEGDEPI